MKLDSVYRHTVRPTELRSQFPVSRPHVLGGAHKIFHYFKKIGRIGWEKR